MRRGTSPLNKPLSSFYKQNPVYLKLIFLFFLLSITIFLYSSHTVDNNNSSLPLQNHTPFVTNNNSQDDQLLTTKSNDDGLETKSSSQLDFQDEDNVDLLEFDKESSPPSNPKCDLFKGDWVPSPNGPTYDNNTCLLIESQQNCMTNGRPDSGYLYWRWKPRDCELPKFDPKRFLNLMRNKGFAFIGDSIVRNQVQSLLCILAQVEIPEQIYLDAQKKSSTWVFRSYNFTLARIWSPFLLKAEIFEDNNGLSTEELKLHLDELDKKWADQYENFDYILIAGGQWFLKTAIYYENNKIQGCHYCPGRNLEELGFDYAYRRALNKVFNFITKSTHKPRVIFRTITSSHFESGEWHNGGHCKRKVPFKESEVSLSDADRMMYEVEIQELNSINTGWFKKEVNVNLFDATRLALLRPDGHPGPYRNYRPFAEDKNAKVQNDCLHWCLPGPIDSWNELVSEMLTRG